MHHVAFQDNPREFLDACGAALEKNGAEHNLILTLCDKVERRRQAGESVPLRAAVLFDDQESVTLAAVQTPPHNLVLSKSAAAYEAERMAEILANNNFRFPGIVGPSDVTSAFCNKWTQLTGQKSAEYMDQIIYVVRRVLFPAPVEGEFRLAAASEAPQLAEWIAAFSKDAKMPKPEQPSDIDALKKAEELIDARRLFVWSVGGRPVAQVAVFGTDDIARVGMVYTPPETRGRGYASAVVAHVSQQQLDQGKAMCCLYADARNPVSNSIYRKIGYEFVARSSMYVLAA